MDRLGNLYKLDKNGRRYPVDASGSRAFKYKDGRVSSRPPNFDATLWGMLSFKEKADVQKKMREQAEGIQQEVVPPPLPGPPAGGVDAADEVEQGAPSPFTGPCSPLGIYGLIAERPAEETGFSDDRDEPDSTSPWDQWEDDIEADLAAIEAAALDPDSPWAQPSGSGASAADPASPADGDTPAATHSSMVIPLMPCVNDALADPHRPLIQGAMPPWSACVARPVGKAEIAKTPAAKAAMDIEWERLRKKKVWNESLVREWGDVAAEARRKGEEIHFGYLFGICVEKNSELAPGNPSRKYKGRVVFQGNRVTNQNWEVALFNDMGSAPATMDASRAADCYGCAPGHVSQVADAEQAFTQAELKGTPCWFCLPDDQRPKGWSRFNRPVVPLLKALYGHPDSGTFWEDHCNAAVRREGFVPVGTTWPSCFYHPSLKLFLVIYVDDFKLAGPERNMKMGWLMLRAGLSIEAEEPAGMYLGCSHEVGKITLPSGRIATSMTYNMEEFLTSCVDRYLELAGGGDVRLRNVATPFLVDDPKLGPSGAPSTDGADMVECPWCKHTFPPKSLPVPKCHGGPRDGGISTAVSKEPFSEKDRGRLHAVAAKILMKILYAARMARFDLLRAVCHLACYITKWSTGCDRRLHRLVCYIHSTKHFRMIGWVGDDLSNLQPHMFADADFAGCTSSQRSTSGLHITVRGPNSCFPIVGCSKRQGCVSHLRLKS
jgi:hypothetical protein